MSRGRRMNLEGAPQGARTHGVRDVARFLWKHVRSRIGLALLVLLFGATAEILQSVIAPIWYKKFIDAVTHVSAFPEPAAVLLSILATTIGIRVVATLCGDIKFRLNSKFQPGIMHEMMVEAFEKTLQLSHRFFADNFTGSLIRKIGRIGGNFEQLMDICMTDAWGILLSIGGIMIVLAPRFPLIAILIFFWIALTVVVKTLYIRYRMPYFAEYSKLDAVSVGIMSDVFSNVSTVQSFGRTKEEVRDFILADQKATGQMVRNWKAHANIDLVSFALNILLEAGALGGMISLLIAGRASVGDVVLVQSFLLVVFGKLNYIARLIRRSTEASTQIEEVLDVIEQTPEIRDLPRAKTLRVTSGEIVFSDVSFKYQENVIFQKLNLQIAPKERVGFVGPSGAGKTTMTKLLLRFFEVQGGDLLIDGQSVKKVTQDSLRQSIAYVPQEPVLFHRSLRENIGYGKPDASMDEIIGAAKKAHCHEFISALTDGYDSLVGERGVKLSGGERQRVAIARAILKNAPILVLDEATSSLDSESEALIQDALRELMKEKTVIVIAHRLSTIMQMDRIIVMEHGKVTDSGTHDQLLKKVGTYQKLWNIQAGGFQNV